MTTNVLILCCNAFFEPLGESPFGVNLLWTINVELIPHYYPASPRLKQSQAR